MESASYFLQSCRLLRQYNLTLTQAQVICALGNDRVTAAEIQGKTGLSDSAVMSCLAYLRVTEDVEIASETEGEARKRRARVYRLTVQGDRLFQQIFDLRLPGVQKVTRVKPHGEDQLVLSFGV